MKTVHAVALLAVLLCACNAPKPAKPTPPPSPAEPVDQAALDARFEKTDIKITSDEFEQLKPGMALEDVVGIVGSPEDASQSQYTPASEDSYTRPKLTKIYRWENPDGSWCELEFIDKQLDTKRHQDLKSAAGYAGTSYTLPEVRRAMVKPVKLSN
jgi:hypothetical protein